MTLIDVKYSTIKMSNFITSQEDIEHINQMFHVDVTEITRTYTIRTLESVSTLPVFSETNMHQLFQEFDDLFQDERLQDERSTKKRRLN